MMRRRIVEVNAQVWFGLLGQHNFREVIRAACGQVVFKIGIGAAPVFPAMMLPSRRLQFMRSSMTKASFSSSVVVVAPFNANRHDIISSVAFNQESMVHYSAAYYSH